MTYTTLISADTLAQHINDSNLIIIDCRFSLADSEAGFKAYRMGHIKNARYAHLDNDLASTISNTTGRHPLPNFNTLVKKLGQWGISNTSQVIVYDDANGAFASRLWWLLRCLGHEAVAVLDGGIKHWQHSLTTTLPQITPKIFRPYLDQSNWLSAIEISNKLAAQSIQLIDARTPERFKGEQEPIDPIAGHIPCAINRAFQLNLNTNGLFLQQDKLRDQFIALIGSYTPEQTVHMCGSGVTACHNLLAMEYAGLSGSKLYAGSWSEWISNQNHPIATHVQ